MNPAFPEEGKWGPDPGFLPFVPWLELFGVIFTSMKP